MRRKKRIAAGVCVALVAVALIVAVASRWSPPVTLSDGTQVRVHSITRGTNHVARLGKTHQRILSYLPQRVLDRWVPGKLLKGMGMASRVTSTNAILVWLEFYGPGKEYFYNVSGEDGVGGQRSRHERIMAANSVKPIELEEWPRGAEKIAINFYGDRFKVYHGRVVLKNPAPAKTAPWEAERIPARKKDGELELTLAALEVKAGGKTFSTRVGDWCAARAAFTFSEDGRTSKDWVVHTMSFRDAGGNRRRATGPRWWNGEEFEIFSDPLFLSEGAWKVEVDVTRGTNFPSEETVIIENVPVPLANGLENVIFRTNLLGHAVTLRSMRRASVGTGAGTHSMGAPGFALELEPRSERWVPKIAAIWNSEGEPMRVPNHGYGEGYSLMRFSAPKGAAELLRVQVTVQPRRRFTFFARPGVVN